MAKRIRSHYIPQFLLKNFTDSNGGGSAYKKDENKFLPFNVSKLFAIKDFYVQFHLDEYADNPSDVAEKRLAALESDAAPEISKIVANADAGSVTALDAGQRETLFKFGATMMMRHPEVQKVVFPNAEVTRIMELSKEGRDRSNSARATVICEFLDWFDEMPSSKGFLPNYDIVITGKSQRGFIIGAPPLPQSKDYLVLPISSTVAVARCELPKECLYVLKQPLIDEINVSTLRNGNFVAAAKREWIEHAIAHLGQDSTSDSGDS